MKWMVGIVNSLSVLVILICISISLPTFCKSFYNREYDKYKIPDTIGVPKDELMTVTDQLLGYMKDERDDLVVYATVDGKYREFFNDREKSHMVDVKNLFMIGFSVQKTAMIVFVLTILLFLFFHVEPWPVMARSCQVLLIGFLLLVVLLFTVIALDFDRAFVIFHELFFSNDLWILNPDTDLLVNIVPSGFFVDIAGLVAVVFVLLSCAVIGGCSLYFHLRKTSSGGPV